MRLLVVTPREPWPPNDGGRVHVYHVLKHLADHADVTLALPRRAAGDDELQRLLRVETVPEAALVSQRPHRRATVLDLLIRRHVPYSPAIEAWLRRHARPERFDAVLLHGTALGHYVPACRVPVVWDPVDELVLHAVRDAQYGTWRRWPAALRHAAVCAWYEHCAASRAAATVFVSAIDAAVGRRWANRSRIEVVANGVDLDYFRPAATPPDPRTILFVGSLDFPPNVDAVSFFVRRVWGRLYERDRRRRLLIVGRHPVAEVRALAECAGVELAANVPDVRPYFARAGVVVAPTRKGGGLKNKILEACAMRRPVVASPRAVAGLSARLGRDLLVADSPRSWVERVERVLGHPRWAAGLAARGCDWVCRAHRWSDAGQRFLEILASVSAGGGDELTRGAEASVTPERPAVIVTRTAALMELAR